MYIIIEIWNCCKYLSLKRVRILVATYRGQLEAASRLLARQIVILAGNFTDNIIIFNTFNYLYVL